MRFDWKGSGLPYVGVWANTPYDGFRIITPTASIGYASTCSIEHCDKAGDSVALSGICEGEGENNPTTTLIRVVDDETINEDGADYNLVRCHLQN